MHKSLGWQLARISWYGRIFIERQLADYDLHGGALPFLIALSHNEGITQEELSRELRIDKTVTTRIAKYLLKTNYITRVKDQEDKRKQRLYLTAKGKNIIPVLKQITQNWTETLVSNFSPAEREELFIKLKKMVANARKARGQV